MTSLNRVVSSEAEELILVDLDDNEIGTLSKAACHDGVGRLHRSFSIFLFNNTGELLLQRRAASKRLWPGYWSNTCCSHPRSGESLEVATRRRLEDELNTHAALEFVFKFQYQAKFGAAGTENELCHIFLGCIKSMPEANRSEIEELKFITPDALDAALELEPTRFTPWFRLEWQRLRESHADVLGRFCTPG